MRTEVVDPVGEGFGPEHVSALLAWRGAALAAENVLLQASRMVAAGSPGWQPDDESRSAIVGLRRLETKIDRYLRMPAAPAPPAP